jgi:hypothetical protein
MKNKLSFFLIGCVGLIIGIHIFAHIFACCLGAWIMFNPPSPVPFDSRIWKLAQPYGIQFRMARDLVKGHSLIGLTKQRVKYLLGQPTGSVWPNRYYYTVPYIDDIIGFRSLIVFFVDDKVDSVEFELNTHADMALGQKLFPAQYPVPYNVWTNTYEMLQYLLLHIRD